MKDKNQKNKFVKMDNESLVLKLLLDEMKKKEAGSVCTEIGKRLDSGENPFSSFTLPQLIEIRKAKAGFYN